MRIKKGFVAQQIGDKTIIVSTGSLCKEFHGMIELNSTGAEIWNWIEKGYDKEQIVEMLSQKYSIDVLKAEADVNKIITKMKNTGVFEEGQ